jgi:hypothetical protein
MNYFNQQTSPLAVLGRNKQTNKQTNKKKKKKKKKKPLSSQPLPLALGTHVFLVEVSNNYRTKQDKNKPVTTAPHNTWA